MAIINFYFYYHFVSLESFKSVILGVTLMVNLPVAMGANALILIEPEYVRPNY